MNEELTHFSTEALPGVREGLWCHKRRSASSAGQQSVVALKLVAHPKVGYLHMAIVAE